MIQRAIGRYLNRETVALGLAGAAVLFAGAYATSGAPDSWLSLPPFIESAARDYLVMATVLAPVIGTIGLAALFAGTYTVPRRNHLFAPSGFAAAMAYAFLFAAGGQISTPSSLAHPLFIAKLLTSWFAAIILIRLIYWLTGLGSAPARRVLLVGDAHQTKALSGRLRSCGDLAFDPVVLDTPHLSALPLLRHNISSVVVASEPNSLVVDMLLDWKLRGIKICSASAFYESHLGRIDIDMLSPREWLVTPGFAAAYAADVLKRLNDIIVGFCLLLLTLPLMALTMLAIKIDSPGPAIYRQQRAGQFDRPFTLLKFRSMTADAEAADCPKWAEQNDPRVTRVGRFIRATRIDELPQLVNILVGEMSLVGPRPERPHFVEQLRRAIPLYSQRSYVKPGLTGWAQINFPYGASVEDAREKLAYDLYYIKNRSFLLDIAVLLSTIRVVLFGKGAR